MAFFIVGLVLVRANFVQSESVTLTQGNWAVENVDSATILPAEDWDEYSEKDAGVVTGVDLHLGSAAHIMIQTSDDGATDSCETANCTPGGGFNAATTVKTGTKVSGTGNDASVILTANTSPEEFSLDLLGSYSASATQGIVVSGTTAYIADGNSGLYLIDVSTASSPSLLGSYNTSGKALKVFVNGNTAYVADQNAGLQIIDVSTPSSPSWVGTFNTDGKAYDVAVSGNYAYVADHNKGLKIIDISAPASPSQAGSFSTSKNALGVVVSGSYAYVAESGNAGLEVIDITTPSSPSLAGSLSTAAEATGGIFMSGNTLYVTIGASGFEIINVSTPSSPSSVAVIDTEGTAQDIAVEGSNAYVAIDTSGLVVIDISTPSSPVTLGTYDTSGTAFAVTTIGGKSYVADDASGLHIIESGTASAAYYASGTFESAVMDLGASVYELDALISDIKIPSGSLPVGLEISADDAGLVALWHMNTSVDSVSSLMDSAGSHTGTLHATPFGGNTTTSAMWDASGDLGTDTYTALEFDGTDDYVSIGALSDSVKTIMFRINHSNPASGDQILELNGSQSISIESSTGDIITSGITSPTIYVDGSSASAALAAGWHHVAVVTDTAMIASNVNLGRVVTGYLSGMLDEVAMYDRVLSANEIGKMHQGHAVRYQVAASNCANGADNPAICSTFIGWGDSDTPFIGSDGTSNSYLNGPVALYHFDEYAGTTLTDMSGFGHDGTLMVGSGGYQSGSASAWTNGKAGALPNLGSQGLYFDGTDDHVSVGDLNTDVKSIEFWIDHNSNNFGGVVLELNATHSIVITTAGNVTAPGFESPTVFVDGSSASATLSSGWHHVAVVTATTVDASDVNLGRVGSIYLAGSLDEVALYDFALSEGAVRARYNNGDGNKGAVFGGISGSSLDNKQYVKFKAFMSSGSMVFSPQINDAAVGYSAFPAGAGLVSSVFDTQDDNSYLTEIAWSETLNSHDVRLQVATSGDGIHWNHCGAFDCSTDDWLDFSDGVGSYYTVSKGSPPNSLSRNIDQDRYIKYKVWLMSNDGLTTPTADDITITYDVATLEVLAPNGTSSLYEARAQSPFDIILKVKDSAGATINNHDGSRTVKLTSGIALPDTDTCYSSFSEKGFTELTRSVVFYQGVATVSNVVLCDDSINAAFKISAVETIGGALKSTEDLTVTNITGPGDKVTATLYWDPLDDCTNFDHYEAWYGLTSNVRIGIGSEWDDDNDPALAVCSTGTTTITDLLPDVKYYFNLFALDAEGNAIALEILDAPAEEEGLDEDLIDEIGANVPDGSKLYDVVIKLNDNHHADSVEDLRGSYKHGDVIAVVANGHVWTENEKRSFLIVPMYLLEEDKAELLAAEVDADGNVIQRRLNKIDMTTLGLTESDARDEVKKKAKRDELRGKRLNKSKAMKEKVKKAKKAKKEKK